MKSLGIASFFPRSIALLALALLGSCGGLTDYSLPLAFTATLNGAAAIPPSASTGEGIGLFVFDPTDRSYTARLAATGVDSNAAHIHQGASGMAGPIVITLTRDPGELFWEARGTLTPEQEASFRAGSFDYYFDAHSQAFPAGEIRGQIERRALSPEQQQNVEDVLQHVITQLRLQSQPVTPAAPAALEEGS